MTKWWCRAARMLSSGLHEAGAPVIILFGGMLLCCIAIVKISPEATIIAVILVLLWTHGDYLRWRDARKKRRT